MKTKKRKYNKSGKYKKDKTLEKNFKDSCKDTGKPILDNVQSITEPLKEQSSVKILSPKITTQKLEGDKWVDTGKFKAELKPFTFEDLPLSIRIGVENIITYRENLKLPDDSKERKQRALNYYKEKAPIKGL